MKLTIDNEFKELLRKQTNEENKRLEQNILDIGCRDSLIIWKEKDILIDGHHRYEICTKHNIEFKTTYLSFKDKDEVLLWIIDNQIAKRNLTEEEKTYYIGKEYEINKRKQGAIQGLPSHNKNGNNQYKKIESNDNLFEEKKEVKESIIDTSLTSKSREEIAIKHNVSENTVFHAQQYSKAVDKLTQNDNELKNKILSGETSLTKKDVIEIAKIDNQDKKDKIIKKIIIENKTLKDCCKEDKIEKRKEEIRQIQMKIKNDIIEDYSNIEFDCVILDPPWAYGRDYDPDNSRIASPYPELDIEGIYQDVIKRLKFNKNCVLWLWTTHKFIFEAKELLEKWGFEYKTILTWDKEKLGMGSWLRMQCEFCLMGVKGKPTLNLTNERDIITESRKEHSRKPQSFYEMVKNLCIGRIGEYYSREKKEGIITLGVENGKLE